MANQSFLHTIYQGEADLYQQVVRHITAGADPSRVTDYAESALRVASNNGRFDVVQLLLDSGADKTQLEWSGIHSAVAFGSFSDLRNAIADHREDLEARDFWSRTPYLLAVLTGSIDKASALLASGADRTVVGRCGKTVFQYAIQHDDVDMLDWLLKNKHDLDLVDEFGTTPLLAASEQGKTACVRFLIEKGVDIFVCDDIPNRALQVASNRRLSICWLPMAKISMTSAIACIDK